MDSEAGALLIPETFAPVRRSIFTTPSLEDWRQSWFWLDLLRNIAAYAPLGFLAVFLVGQHDGRNAGIAGLRIIILGSVLSLAIETIQILLPGRNSAVIDLIANSLGTTLGVAIAFYIRRRHGATESSRD